MNALSRALCTRCERTGILNRASEYVGTSGRHSSSPRLNCCLLYLSQLGSGARTVVDMDSSNTVAETARVAPIDWIPTGVRIWRARQIRERGDAQELASGRVVVAVVYDPYFRSGRPTRTAPSWDWR